MLSVTVSPATSIIPHHMLNSGGLSNKFLNFLCPFLCPEITFEPAYASIHKERCLICEHHAPCLIVITITPIPANAENMVGSE